MVTVAISFEISWYKISEFNEEKLISFLILQNQSIQMLFFILPNVIFIILLKYQNL